jgi:hypothetical protein
LIIINSLLHWIEGLKDYPFRLWRQAEGNFKENGAGIGRKNNPETGLACWKKRRAGNKKFDLQRRILGIDCAGSTRK